MAYKNFKTYALNVAIAVDQLANAIIFGNPDETLSSRCYRNSQKYWYAECCRKVLDLMFRPWGPEHCRNAYESELKNKHNFNATEETPITESTEAKD